MIAFIAELFSFVLLFFFAVAVFFGALIWFRARALLRNPFDAPGVTARRTMRNDKTIDGQFTVMDESAEDQPRR